jgi:hypothetical protein
MDRNYNNSNSNNGNGNGNVNYKNDRNNKTENSKSKYIQKKKSNPLELNTYTSPVLLSSKNLYSTSWE